MSPCDLLLHFPCLPLSLPFPSSPPRYRLEDVEVAASEFIRGVSTINLLDFRRAWEALGGDSGAPAESVKKYSLAMTDLQEAVDAVVDFVGLAPVEASHRVPDGASLALLGSPS